VANPVIREILRQGRGRPKKHVLAALATGQVESGFRNLTYGDADSQGWRQERASLYPNPTNLKASVRRFYQEAAKLDRGQRPGELAADVQRPAAQYRGRYRAVMPEMKQLLRGQGGVQSAAAALPGTPGKLGKPATVQIGQATSFDQEGFDRAKRLSVLAQMYARSGKTNSVLFKTGILSLSPPSPADFTSTSLTSSMKPGTNPTPGRVGVMPGQGGRGKSQVPKGGLKRVASVLDAEAAIIGAPVSSTMRSPEENARVGGSPDYDHLAAPGRLARDYGGSEAQRYLLWKRLMKQLGVKGARYKGADVNVTRNGIRYQIISRDHGTGPHLHVGLRRV
jgi:hypothetical protein